MSYLRCLRPLSSQSPMLRLLLLPRLLLLLFLSQLLPLFLPHILHHLLHLLPQQRCWYQPHLLQHLLQLIRVHPLQSLQQQLLFMMLQPVQLLP